MSTCGFGCSKCSRTDWTCPHASAGCPLPPHHHVCPECLQKYEPIAPVCEACLEALKCEYHPKARLTKAPWRCECCLTLMSPEVYPRFVDRRRIVAHGPPKLFLVIRMSMDGGVLDGIVPRKWQETPPFRPAVGRGADGRTHTFRRLMTSPEDKGAGTDEAACTRLAQQVGPTNLAADDLCPRCFRLS